MNGDQSPPASARTRMSIFLWWRPDSAAVQRQVAQYDSLGINSARSMSAILCVLTAVLTAVFTSGNEGAVMGERIEAGVWLALALFMYRGHRWAFIIGMTIWTLDKGMILFGGASSAGRGFSQVIFWFLYMTIFYLGYTVEKQRAAAPR
jgi:hypothetical protein